MPNIKYWAEAAAPSRICARGAGAETPPVRAVKFMRHMRPVPSPNLLYVGEAEEIYGALKTRADLRGVFMFAAGEKEGLAEAAESAGATVVCSELDMLDIYERLTETAQTYMGWEKAIERAENADKSINDVVCAASEAAGVPVAILNSGNRVIYSAGDGESAGELCSVLMSSGSLPPEMELELFGERAGEEEYAERTLKDGTVCRIGKVFKLEKLISRMLIFVPGDRRSFDAETLLGMIREAISRIVLSREGTEYWAGAEFRELLDDIAENRETEEDAINRRLGRISRVPQRFCTFVIIESDAGREPPKAPEHLYTQLEELFPDSNITEYKNSVVVLLSRPDRVFQPTPIFDYEKFSRLLAQSGACAAISNATSRRSMLRTNYLLTKSILQMGKALRQQPTQRIFYFEDYAEYMMIDLCINSFSELLGHDDIIYLTHPEAIVLARYDEKHGTNLLDVLYYYCVCNGSIASTAKLSYMHRNTVTAKMNLIRELIQADFSDGQVQQRMIFSYKILRYYDKYAKINTRERINIAEPKPQK